MGDTLTTAAASGLSEEVVKALTDGCSSVASGATEAITAVLPLGMGIMALTMGIRIAVSFFRSLVS